MTATITDQGTGTPTGGATGRVSRVIGPVIDAEFPANAMPEIYNALTTEIDLNGQRRTVTFEVAQHLGDNMVRAISCSPPTAWCAAPTSWTPAPPSRCRSATP